MVTKMTFILGVFLTLVIEHHGAIAAMNCPDEWSAYGKHCYKVFLGYVGEVNQTIAIDRCNSEGAQLVSIHSEEENKFIKGLVDNAHMDLGYNRFWIGLEITRNSATGKMINCHWLDGTEMNYGNVMHVDAGTAPWAHFKHADPEPNNSDDHEACVRFTLQENDLPMVHNDWGWDDSNCAIIYDNNGFICKK